MAAGVGGFGGTVISDWWLAYTASGTFIRSSMRESMSKVFFMEAYTIDETDAFSLAFRS